MSTMNHLQSNRSKRGWHCGWLWALLALVLPISSLSASEIQIAAGQSHTLVLAPDGRVWAFGDDSSGQLGDDTTQADKSAGVVVSGLTNIIAVAAGREHSLALRADGTVFSWGSNSSKQLGNITDNTATFKTTPQVVNGLSYIVSIAAGTDHSLAVDRAGNVYAWGSDNEGQLGNGATVGNQVVATVVQAVGGGGSLAKVIAVAGGFAHSTALLADGTVVAWGRDDEGQLGNGALVVADQTVPVVVTGLSNVTAIANGQYHSLARLADGTVRTWGKNDVGQLGTLSPTNQSSPVNPAISSIKGVFAGENHSVFLVADGTLLACGNDAQGAVGNNASFANIATPTAVSLSGSVRVRTVGAGGNHTVVALCGGGFRSWGADNQAQLGNGPSPSANQGTPSLVDVTWPMVSMMLVDAGQSHTVGLLADGSVWAWGNGSSGQLGDNLGGSSLTPVQVKGAGGSGTLGEILAISSGGFGDHVLALAGDGSVWSWGRGSSGQLGNNASTNSLAPTKVRNPANSADLQNIIAVAAGDSHSLALAVDGTVYAWGSNPNGQLGNNTTSASPTMLPVKVKVSGGVVDLGNIKRLSAGYAHSLAINSSGDLIGWGSDVYGQLSDGVSSSNKVVAYTMDSGEWIAVAGGAYHTRAIRHDSSLAACGYNYFGQLGIGSEVDQNTLLVNGFAYSRGIAAGTYHSLTWQTWGGMYGAGWNDYAQLGLGSKTTKVTSQNQITSLGNYPYQMDGGYLHSVILKADGTIWCSGYNGSGQLGTGTTAEALEPAQTSATWLPTITITASDASANEQGLDQGVFTITRTGTTAGAMTVRVALDPGTTAASGDYSPTIPSTITIPQGQASTTFTVTPTQDFVNEPSESVILRLQQVAGDPYVLGSASTQVATVTILDNDPVGLETFQVVSPRLLTSESEVLNNTNVYYDGINDRDVIVFAPGTDLSAARANMLFYLYDGDNGGPNDTTGQILGVSDLADEIYVSPGTLLPSFGASGTIYIGYYSYFAVRLTSQPSASVTIRLQSGDTSEGTISPNSLTFTPFNWNGYQYVYLYSVDDSEDEGAGVSGDQLYTINFIPPTASEALDPAYVGVTHAAIPVTNVDNDEAGVVISTASVVVAEGGNKDGFSVRLASRPGKDVTIDLSTIGNQVNLDPISLVFTSDDWDQPQAVSVAAVDDEFVEGGHSETLTFTLTSIDSLYDGLDVSASAPTVSIADNDTAGIEIIPATSAMSPLIAAEEDASGTTLKIRLTASPALTKNVRVVLGISGWPGLPGDSPYFNAMASSVSLDFDSTNWDDYQTVTLHVPTDANNAAEDFIVSVTTDDANTTDNNFDPTTTTIYCRTQDNDTTGIVLRNLTAVDPLAADTGTNVIEGGTTDRVGVRLSVIPDASETIVVSLNGGAQTSISPAFLVFNATNFSSEQVVTVSAVDDFIDEAATSAANISFSLNTYGSGSPVYNNSIATSLIANVTDNDTAGIVVTPTSGLVTTEAGGQATFSMVLTSQPADSVTVGLSVGGLDSDEAQLAVASAVFTPANWNQTQTITVTGRPDSLDDGDRSYTIVTAAATVAGSGDSNYAGRNPADVQGTNVDDDAVGVVLSLTNISVSEGGAFTDYTIRLASQPTSAVTVTINPGNQLLVDTDTVLAGYQNTLQFDPDNLAGRIWSTARTVRVTAIDDDLAENNPETVLITHTATGADYANVVIANVSVSVTDNDTAGFLFNGLVSVPAGLTTTESGGTASYTMRLRSQPTAEVRFTLVTSDTAAGAVDVDDQSPGVQDTLIFTPANWNTDRTVTITGVDDDVVDGDQGYNITSYTAVSADFKYNGLVPLAVPCTTTDNDAASIAITPTTGLTTTEGGGQATFSVVLTSQPTDTVIVTFSSSSTQQGTVDTDAVAPNNQSTLTFTPATWDVVRTVTITGADGDNADNGVSGIDYQILTALVDSNDTNYDGIDPVDVDVTNLSVNQAPTLAAISNLTIPEDASLQNIALTGISDGQTGEGQTLSFSAVSDNLTLIPSVSVAYTSGTTGTLSFTPAANETGTATITVTLTDSGGPGTLAAESIVRTFTVTVTEVNDRPTLDVVTSPVSLNEDAPTQNLTLAGLGSGAANESQNLTVTIVSNNTALIPNPLFTSSGSNVVVLTPGTTVADLTYAPVANTNGSAVITITVQDDGGTAGGGVDTFSRQFTVNVAVVNDPPTLDDPADLTLNEDAGLQSINLTGITSGAANESQALVVTASSNNTSLIPNPTLSYASPGAAGTLSFTPTADLGGQATITVIINDGGGGTQTFSQTFTVTVNPINDVPVAATSAASGRKVPIGTNRLIATTDLYATDVDSAQPAPAHDPGLIFTVQLAPGQGYLLRDQDTLDAPTIDPADAVVLELGDTFTQQDLIDGRISYTHDGGSGASDGFAFTVSDSGIAAGSVSASPVLPASALPASSSGLQVFTITIDRRPPVITLLPATTLAFSEDDPATRIALSSTLTDGDFNAGTGFNGGRLTVDFSTGGTVSDVIDFDTTGPITLAGSNVLHNGNLIGNFTSTQTTSGTILEVNFTSVQADLTSVADLIRHLTFRNISQAASSASTTPVTSRIVRMIMTDDNGDTSSAATRSVDVTSVNDAPTSSTTTSLVTGVNVPISGTLSVNDVDGDVLSFAQQGLSTLGTVSVNAVTGAYTFTPASNQSGSGTFTIRVSDPLGASTDIAFNVTISADSATRPWITSDPPMWVLLGDSVDYNIVAESSSASPTFTVVGLAPTDYVLSVSGRTATLTLPNTTLTSPGYVTFGILVSDGLLTGFQPVTILVVATLSGGG